MTEIPSSARVAGMRYIFHVAADYRLWARDPSEIFATNVEGTRNLMEEAMRAGVERDRLYQQRGDHCLAIR